jgi:xylose isomerase
VINSTVRHQNEEGISIVQHLVTSNEEQESMPNEYGHSSMTKSFITEGGTKVRRKSQKKFEFQHEDKIDFHFIHDVDVDKKSRKSLEKEGVHYIKNPTESGGDLKHIA